MDLCCKSRISLGRGVLLDILSLCWGFTAINPLGLCRARQVYLTTLLLFGLSLLSDEPVLCTFLSENKENDVENIMINLHERMLPTRRWTYPQAPDNQSDAHPIEPPRPASPYISNENLWKLLDQTAEQFVYIPYGINHYENMPIQIHWKFYHQKMKIFR